eukprot:scaffold14473_cov56-Phaeocystis_antarctica.AAC.3
MALTTALANSFRLREAAAVVASGGDASDDGGDPPHGRRRAATTVASRRRNGTRRTRGRVRTPAAPMRRRAGRDARRGWLAHRSEAVLLAPSANDDTRPTFVIAAPVRGC